MNFWDYHGWGFIICMMFFPRLTMLFATTMTYGLWSWLGWFFVPRLTVAIFAMMTYSFNENPVLIVFTWLWALSGTSVETKTASQCVCRKK